MTATDEKIRVLITEYKTLKIWQIAKRRELRNKIYEIALPDIKKKLSAINSIDDEIRKSEYHRVYANTANYLFSSKKFNSKSFDNISNPKSKKNAHERDKIKYLFELFTAPNVNYSAIDKALRRMDAKEKAAFEHITGVNLNFLDINS